LPRVALAAWLVPVPVSAQDPTTTDETLKLRHVITLPDSQVLRSYDISWVNPRLHTYALAASALTPPGKIGTASNPAIVIVDTLFDVVVKELGLGTSSTPTPFAGNCPTPPGAVGGLSGPNGVIVIEKRWNADVWAGDGPIFTTQCDPTTVIKRHSQLVVFDLFTGALKKTISTGGIRRADELCYNPVSDVVLVANDESLDNFITFVGEDSPYPVLQKISFKGGDPNAGGIVAFGIEQCQFNPRDGKFYLNIPHSLADGSGPGYVLRISAFPPFHVEAKFLIPIATGCTGPAGLAVGPDSQLGVGCGGKNSLIIADGTGILPGGTIIQSVTGVTSDEDWYNPGSNHYYFAQSNPGVVGAQDAGPPPASTPDPAGTSASGSHSVAADPFLNKVYVPIGTSLVAVPVGQNPRTVCGSGLDVFGSPGSNPAGCIAVYHARNDSDDISAESENGQGENEGGNGQGNGNGNGNGEGNGNGQGNDNGQGNGDN
jgi:hypothetical protein